MDTLVLLAEGEMSWLASPILPLILVFVVFYFVVIRAKRKDEKKRRDMLSELKRGDKVMTIGGIIGKVIDAADDEVVLKVDESNNVKIRFRRSAIHQRIDEEADAPRK